MNSFDARSAEDLLTRISGDPALAPLFAHLDAGGPTSVRGASGSSTVFLSGALAQKAKRPIVLVLAHMDDAEEACDELRALQLDAQHFPALEVLPGESAVSLDLLTRRLELVQSLRAGALPQVLVAPIAALMQGIPDPSRLSSLLRTISTGDSLPMQAFTEWLIAGGYERADTIERAGEFAISWRVV